jgi:4-alpha-glucanotransferase
MLPVGPPGYGESPYSAESAFAGNPFLVSPEGLAREGLLDAALATPSKPLRADRIDFSPMEAHRWRLLRAALEGLSRRPDLAREFASFREENAGWLDDFALFRALKRAHGGVQWTRWEPSVRRREPAALASARVSEAASIALEQFVQFVFARQWGELRARAAELGIGLVGDLPIFVAHDSADVWQNPDAFFLDDEGEPSFVAGVPPDYFSATGQRWGNPLYRWKRLARSGYAWWIERMRATLARFDAVRLDHFIGFQRYWRIPASEPTAVKGKWMKGPGAPLFDALRAAFGPLPLIAEDLGEVTPRVHALRDRYGLPGIKILQFAFGKDPAAPSFLPHDYTRRAVVYTGTHDNDTTVGWFNGGDSRSPAQVDREQATALRYLGTSGREIHWEMMRAAFASVAGLAIVPVQDLLGLGSEARMNRPGIGEGNWTWRLSEGALTPALAARLAELTRTYGRADGASAPRAARSTPDGASAPRAARVAPDGASAPRAARSTAKEEVSR